MENKENKIIFDINIASVQDLYSILLNKGYDFVTLEPEEEKVSVKFRKDWKIVEEKFIKYPIYTEIVIKAKTISNLDVWETKETQEWTWDTEVDGKKFKSLTKVVPGNFWEKLFLKLKAIEEKPEKKAAQKVSLGQFVWFLWVVLIILIIVLWAWLAFIVINAKTVDDVRFFLMLWININDINSFIAKTIMVVFSILVVTLTIFLIVFLFKFLTTKKIYKKKKTKFLIISVLVFIFTFSTAWAWMFLDKKVRELPEWNILALWDVKVYDNAIYNRIIYEDDKIRKNREADSFIDEKNRLNIIWPIDLRFDIETLAKREEKNWLKIKKYIWTFGNSSDKEETFVPVLESKTFDKVWNYEVAVEIELEDQLWEITKKSLNWLPKIWIAHLVKITEKVYNTGRKNVTFDANSMKSLWKMRWYPEWKTEPVTWYIYTTESIVEETSVYLWVWDEKNNYGRLFIINWDQAGKVNWSIEYEVSPMNDREYKLYVKDLNADKWLWAIEKFTWRIEWKIYEKEWEEWNQEKASETKHIFWNYWKYTVTVEMSTTSWETRKITKEIDVWRELKIKDPLKFTTDWQEVEAVHNSQTWDYIIRDYWIPSTLTIDARYVKPDNMIYSLEEISWDYESDWKIDSSDKKVDLTINKEWKQTVTVNYKFKNIRIPEEVIDVKEKVYIEAVKKEYEVNFKINQNTEYAPAIIGFDASKSTVRDSNISKFIWDFWDWIKEEADAVIEGHRYLSDGEYTVSLTVVTSDWKKYSTSKKLVLKPKAQKVKIKSSMKNAPVYQWIDFDSSDSIWDIISYYWDFWDWENSTEANPSHFYKKPWEYKVTLRVDFRNRNIMEDTMNITISQ